MKEVAFDLGFEGQGDSGQMRMWLRTRTGLGGEGVSLGLFDLPGQWFIAELRVGRAEKPVCIL